ncbi:hypothetical protein [Pyrobaculum ferrireducens]|uniref:Uncharacterized protein n=1 Tax=Pyrobaculum ferrireducens TaxID=1104324 RepID=G7VFM7_9CREN|nr:hypothetical protein [Pyrobaculum ferrireducens]AET34233.1 hypothetical protein P186_2857 [Pyrobaculum ferrireducens]
MEVIAIARGPAPGLYYIATAPPRCGLLGIKLAELPIDAEPPFKATYIKTRHGTALLNISKINIDKYLLDHIDQVIEGEVMDGVLEGVACNKKITIRVLDRSLSGPVIAVVPVYYRRRKIPQAVFTLLAYKLQLV